MCTFESCHFLLQLRNIRTWAFAFVLQHNLWLKLLKVNGGKKYMIYDRAEFTFASMSMLMWMWMWFTSKFASWLSSARKAATDSPLGVVLRVRVNNLAILTRDSILTGILKPIEMFTTGPGEQKLKFKYKKIFDSKSTVNCLYLCNLHFEDTVDWKCSKFSSNCLLSRKPK